MYSMLGLFVYIYIYVYVYAILFSELFENTKKMFHMEVVWLHAGNLTWYFDFFFSLSIYIDVWRGLNANVSFFFFFFKMEPRVF